MQIPATAPVVHHGPGGLVCTERPHFGELIRSGFVAGDTVVIDLTLASVGDLRARGFEMPARDCWHAKAWGALAT